MKYYDVGALSLGLTSILLPLGLIALSAYLYPNFNLYYNALSDLGNPLTSNVAPIFNLALTVCGFTMGLYSFRYLVKVSKAIAYLLLITSFNLILIGTFNESYDKFLHLHFLTSVTFFSLLASFLISFCLLRGDFIPSLPLVASILAWLLHLAYGVPKGAALPEIVSIASSLPFYAYLVVESSRRKGT